MECSSVDYRLAVEDRGDYLRVRVSGKNTPEVIRAYLRDVNVRCASMQRFGVLIEEHLEGPALSTMEIYQIASDVQGASRPVARRIAFVDLNPEHPRRNMKFAEDVAVNRGVNMRVFDLVEDADRWLKQAEA
jgi:hypothetical protein